MRKTRQSVTFPLFDWAEACDVRARAERRSIARPPMPQTRDKGALAYLSGLAAESAVGRHYERLGHPIRAQRWRGKAGEIDLIVADGDGFIFVEVKKARSFDRAAHALSGLQALRIQEAAGEYCGMAPKGLLTPARVDLALVDAIGDIRIIENAIVG